MNMKKGLPINGGLQCPLKPALLVLLLALLIGYSAGSLAGTLAGSLALAAAAVYGAVFEACGLNGLNMLHGYNLLSILRQETACA